jgi:hypothetical protein
LGKAGEVTKVVLPNGVTAISGDAFRDFGSLTSVTVPAECARIADRLVLERGGFSGCGSLVKVAVAKGCTSIDHSALKE